METWSWTCACGVRQELETPAPPRLDAARLIRATCDECGLINYFRLPAADGSEARKMAKETITRQLTILDIFAEQEPPLTVRGIFYACVVKGIIPKTEAGYRAIQYQLVEMRRAGTIPYGWIADYSRSQMRPTSYSSLETALQRTRETYRRSLWDSQDVAVEIWVEKMALTGVFWPITREFDVPLMIPRGFSSVTFLYEAAEEIKQNGKPTHIYHFGDYDYEGILAGKKIAEGLQEFGASITFERLAVTEVQISRYNLPTRPPKGRSKKNGFAESVELDAIPAPILRDLARDCITQHIDPYVWADAQRVEAMERETLGTITRSLKNFGTSTKNTNAVNRAIPPE